MQLHRSRKTDHEKGRLTRLQQSQPHNLKLSDAETFLDQNQHTYTTDDRQTYKYAERFIDNASAPQRTHSYQPPLKFTDPLETNAAQSHEWAAF